MNTCSVVRLTSAFDTRGMLTAAQYPEQIPFPPQRIFVVTMNPAGAIRGGHAHHRCHQFLIAASGRVQIEYDTDSGTQSVVLGSPSEGLYIPPLVWARQEYLEIASVLVVLASHSYDVSDYIDDRFEAARLRTLKNRLTHEVKSPFSDK